MRQAVTTKLSIPQIGLFGWLGMTIGVIMPVISAVLYPVYMHQMQPPWAEWTRLLELPFIACELAIILVALNKGYRDVLIWRRLPKDVVIAFGLLLVGLVASSFFVSKTIAVSVTLSIATLVHLRLAAAIYFLALMKRDGTTRPILHQFGSALVIGLAVLTVLTVWKFQLPPPELTVPGGKIEWASSLPGFINVRYFGSWAGAIACGLMVALLYGKQDRPNIYNLCYLLAAGLTFWSGTRAAVLAMGAVAIILAISLRRLPNAQALARVGGLSALAMLGAIVFAPGEAAFSLFMRDNLDSANALTSGRVALWKATFARWLDAPLFGWGSGSTFWEVYVNWWHTQPHNTILLFLISWGVVGATGASWLLARAIAATHRTGMSSDDLRPITGALYGLLFMSLFAGMMHYPRFVMLIMICFGVLFAARDRADQA